ncbi:MAG: hypothetical protein ACF8MJ_03035 [Phycisphaerales bacterium JB050]
MSTPFLLPTTDRRPTSAENRFGINYRDAAQALGRPPVAIIDAHSHINGSRATEIYAEARAAFGITHTFSQTQLSQVDAVRSVLGDSVSFVAIPDYMSDDPLTAHTTGFLEALDTWRDLGASMVKFWCGPRGRDMGAKVGNPMLMTLESEWRQKQMERAAELGYAFMVHIADPDTWFSTKYADASFYGTKASHYEELEKLADRYTQPWLLAHMGGWPEDLAFLDGLLERHPNFLLDTSATRWMVRELSKHPSDELVAFFKRHEGRILFGSDIVTMDAHLTADPGPRDTGRQASSEDQAFDLYASRYCALRLMFETDYRGASPIADPDLHMIDPERYTPSDAPPLTGHAMPEDMLRVLYRNAAENTLMKWYQRESVAP